MIKPASGRFRFYGSNLMIPLLLGVLVFVAFDLTGLDRMLSDMLYDPAAGVFPLGESHLFEKITHKWARILPNWTGEVAIIGALLSFIWPLLEKRPNGRLMHWAGRARIAAPLRFTHRYRLDFFYVVVAFALSTGAIHFLKSHTSVYCPVETTLYGGAQAHYEWYKNFTLWHEAGAGRCWPGGHASSAFSLFALYFVARRHAWPHTRLVFAAVTVLGLIYGTTRVLQGWHYMSHTFWAGLVVWLVMFVVALCFYGRSRLQQPLNNGRKVQRSDTLIVRRPESVV